MCFSKIRVYKSNSHISINLYRFVWKSIYTKYGDALLGTLLVQNTIFLKQQHSLQTKCMHVTNTVNDIYIYIYIYIYK